MKTENVCHLPIGQSNEPWCKKNSSLVEFPPRSEPNSQEQAYLKFLIEKYEEL